MLAGPNRLTKKKDFGVVFKKGKKYEFTPFRAYLRTKKNVFPESRFGFIVSKKISKKAVVRNKIKRKMREAIKNNLSGIKKGFDVVIIALPGIEDNPRDIDEFLMTLVRKAGLTL